MGFQLLRTTLHKEKNEKQMANKNTEGCMDYTHG